MKSYRKRVLDDLLARRSQTAGAILVEGIKWCGKTTTCEQAAKSVVYLDEPEKREHNLLMAKIRPSEILDGATPRLIDEWQQAPVLWDAIRYRVDHAEVRGQYLLTGSAVPSEDSDIRHSGTGRFAWLKMRPMSLYESGESSGEVSLSGLFRGEDRTGAHPVLSELPDVAQVICRGGWPVTCGMSGELALDASFDYLEAVVKRDISRVDGVARDEDRARRIMRSYARLQGTQSTAAVIKEDLVAHEAGAFNEDTVYSYINALKRIFAIEDMPAWCPNLRCKTPIRTSDTRYYTDPSIATAALRIGPGGLMGDLPTFGFLFEALAVRDLRVYADALMGDVRHYHDASGLECDAVVYLRNGSYGLVEIKLGGQPLIDKGATTLVKLAGKIDTGKMPRPSFLMVLTAVGDCAYRRPDDNVFVCPIGCLKP
ncbi:MAG: ATP-binding protein [bacterium]|nr:ATP-binding protein [bacterium]